MRTQAIILKKIPAREYDDLVACYTKDAGKQTFRAKSVRRPTSKQASHLDILNLVDFSLIQGNGHPIITSGHALQSWPNLKSSLRALACGYFLLECFDRLVFDAQSDTNLWNCLLDRLEALDRLAQANSPDWSREIKTAQHDLLTTLGYDPSASIEGLANARFQSLQFLRKVLK